MMLTVGVVVIIIRATVSIAFTIPQPTSNCARRTTTTTTTTTSSNPFIIKPLHMAEGTNGENQVVELVDDNIEEQSNEIATTNEPKEEGTSAVAPFLSQGEISEEVMEMNWNDPKQTRVIFYIILSLIPVVFLLPLMLGSRDLIPLDALPPVPLS